jgi:hypothetical protein
LLLFIRRLAAGAAANSQANIAVRLQAGLPRLRSDRYHTHQYQDDEYNYKHQPYVLAHYHLESPFSVVAF